MKPGDDNKNEQATGWVCLHRSLLYDGWIKNHKLLVLWIYCLLKASYKECKMFIGNQRVTIKPGQFIFGLKKAAQETGLSIQSTRTFLNILKKMKNLTITSTNKFSVITINNWTLYQGKDDKSNNQNNTCLTRSQHTANNIQQSNKGNKETKDLYMDFVFLSKKEYEKLIENFGEKGCQEWIEKLNIYIGKIGEDIARKKYRSHYHTILSWARRNNKGEDKNEKSKYSNIGEIVDV